MLKWVIHAHTEVNMALALVYDPRYQDFVSWASLMCEAYAGQQLAVPADQTDWREWAAGLKAMDIFTNEGIPGPYVFGEWQDWAAALVGAVNQRVE
jgi:hypothetical protein